MGRSLDELCEAICWIDRRPANPQDLWRNRQRHHWSRQSDLPTDCGPVSGVKQREERVATGDPVGDDRSEYEALAGGGSGAISAGPRGGIVAECRQLRTAQALCGSDAVLDASA